MSPGSVEPCGISRPSSANSRVSANGTNLAETPVCAAPAQLQRHGAFGGADAIDQRRVDPLEHLFLDALRPDHAGGNDELQARQVQYLARGPGLLERREHRPGEGVANDDEAHDSLALHRAPDLHWVEVPVRQRDAATTEHLEWEAVGEPGGVHQRRGRHHDRYDTFGAQCLRRRDELSQVRGCRGQAEHLRREHGRQAGAPWRHVADDAFRQARRATRVHQVIVVRAGARCGQPGHDASIKTRMQMRRARCAAIVVDLDDQLHQWQAAAALPARPGRAIGDRRALRSRRSRAGTRVQHRRNGN